MYKEKGVRFKTAPVAGPNYHGQVERMIQSVQMCLEKMGADKMRLHATGFRVVMVMVEQLKNPLY